MDLKRFRNASSCDDDGDDEGQCVNIVESSQLNINSGTLQHVKENSSKTRQRQLVSACTEIGRNSSRR
jgi:hypothetical protein